VRVACLVVVSLGCGRLSFDPLVTATDASTDVLQDAEIPLNCTGRIICDGFEGTNLAPNWNTQTASGTVAIDTMRSHRGGRALRAHTNAGISGDSRKAEIVDTTQLPTNATPRILYTRMWGYFPSPHANAYNQYITYANTSGNGFAMGDRNLNITTNHFDAVAFGESGTTQLPRDRWVCLQFEAPTNQTGTVRAFIDGNEVTDIALAVTAPEAAMTQLFIGIDWAGLSMTIPAVDVWLDDLIVDDSPISCAD
jgi:hypothetical protein